MTDSVSSQCRCDDVDVGATAGVAWFGVIVATGVTLDDCDFILSSVCELVTSTLVDFGLGVIDVEEQVETLRLRFLTIAGVSPPESMLFDEVPPVVDLFEFVDVDFGFARMISRDQSSGILGSSPSGASIRNLF
jgi:hypothetical protein